MQNIQERLLKREFVAKRTPGSTKLSESGRYERHDSTASPQTAGMSKHETLKLLEIIWYPRTVIHNILEEHQMMEFLEFPVETSLPLLNFTLGVRLLQSDRTQHWELYETALAKSSWLEMKDSPAPLPKLTCLGKNTIYVSQNLASFPLRVSLALSSLICKQPRT